MPASAQIAAGNFLSGVLPAAGSGSPRVRRALQRKAPEELTFEGEHPPGVGFQRGLASGQQGRVPGVVQVLQFATKVVVIEIGRVDAKGLI
jgi:hypothetical protein